MPPESSSKSSAGSSHRKAKRKLDRASRLLEEDKYSADGWNAMIRECQKKPRIEEQRPTLDAFLEVFPTAARQWKYYIEREMHFKHYERVESLFQKCLLSCLDIELWRLYLSYIKMVKRGTKEERSSVSEAYQFVLKHMGQHLQSRAIWAQYIQWLKDAPSNQSNEFANRIERVRAAYQKAVVSPIEGVDLLWRDYDQWENANHKVLAKGLLSKIRPAHDAAVKCCRERKRIHRNIISTMLARPSGGPSHIADRNYKQFVIWQELFGFEQSNMQKLGLPELKRRLVFTYKQGLTHLRHYPQVWKSYAAFVSDPKRGGTVDEGIAVWEQAITAKPTDHLTYFMYAEFLELNQKHPDIRVKFDLLLEKAPAPIVWCQYMKVLRRTEGKEAARKLFIKAIKSEHSSYHVYVCAGEIEQYINKDNKVATKLYRMGFDKHLDKPKYVMKYISFLRNQNDHQNLRVVYERVLPDLDPKHPLTRTIWEGFVDFQNQLLELSLIHKADERRAKAFGSSLEEQELNMIQRMGFMDLMPVPKEYVQTLRRNAPKKKASLVAVEAKQDEADKEVYSKPDVNQLIMFRPGIRFLKRLSQHQPPPMPALGPALTMLMKRLPAPEHTQLFYHATLPGPANVNINILMQMLRVKELPVKLPGFGPKGVDANDLFAQRRQKRIALAQADNPNVPVAAVVR